MVRMMDSLILHNLPSLGYTRITAAKTTTTTAATEACETKSGAPNDLLNTADRTNTDRSDIGPVKHDNNGEQLCASNGVNFNNTAVFQLNSEGVMVETIKKFTL